MKLSQSDCFGHEFVVDTATAGGLLGELDLDDRGVYATSAEVLTEGSGNAANGWGVV